VRSGLAGQTRAVARRMLAVLVLLAPALAVGCGGQESKGHRDAATKSPGAAPLTIGPGRSVDIGRGRTLYLQCVGSGRPTVVPGAGFGSDTFQWQDVQPQLGRTTRTCARSRASSVHIVALNSNHDVPSSHSGQPSVVIRAAQAVVGAAGDHTRLPPCRRLFNGSDVRCRG
jgi:hypothetical protein